MPMTYFATIMILRRWSAYRKTSGLRGRNRGNPSTSPLSPGGRGVGGEGDEWRVWLAFWNRQNSRVGCAQRITIRRFAAGLLTFPNWTIKKNERTADNAEGWAQPTLQEFYFDGHDHLCREGTSRPFGKIALRRLPAMMDEPASMRGHAADGADQSIPVGLGRSVDLGSFLASLNRPDLEQAIEHSGRIAMNV